MFGVDMPYLPHWRVTTHFSLGASGAPKEEATCTLNFRADPFDSLPGGTAQGMANDMFEDWATWMTSADAKVSNDVLLDGLKLYSIGTDGRIDEDPVIAEGTATRGAFSSDKHPWQCSMVMTLVAGVRGKGRFGRIYLPPQCYAMDSNGLVNNTTLTGMFAATKTLLTNLSDAVGPDLGFGLVVAGRTGTGTLRDVTEVRMGRVADTQRRRRRSLDEAYVIEAFSA